MPLTRWSVVGTALLVVVALLPVWAAYGALLPSGDHGEMAVDLHQFQAASERYRALHQLDDGSVYATPEAPIPVLVRQYGFAPNVLRMRVGETYQLQFASRDVAHGFSLHLGAASWNLLVMPGSMAMLEIRPTRSGEYLFLCNEYCGVGHQFMSGRIVVEGDGGSAPAAGATTQPAGEHVGH